LSSPVRLLVSIKSMTVSGSNNSVEKEHGVATVDGVENEDVEVFRPLLLLPPPPPPPMLLELVAAMGNRRDSTMQSAVRTMVSLGGLWLWRSVGLG
jgi:hypothetical protein